MNNVFCTAFMTVTMSLALRIVFLLYNDMGPQVHVTKLLSCITELYKEEKRLPLGIRVQMRNAGSGVVPEACGMLPGNDDPEAS